MRAIDTNIVVRFLTNDHPKQSPLARAALLEGDIFLPLTVCLESEWVLRSAYGFSKADIARKLSEVAGLPGIEVEDPEVLGEALDGLRQGMDFADALHLATAMHCSEMLSFDKKLSKFSKKLGLLPVVQP